MPTLKKTVRRPWMPERETQGRRIYANTKFYQSSAWRRLRAEKIARNPLCEECHKMGIIEQGTVVDHIVPINQGGAPLSLDNLQTLCDRCHNRKSGREAHQRNRG